MSRFEKYLGNNWTRDGIVDKYQEYMRIPYTPQNMTWLFEGHIEDKTKSKEWNEQFVEDNHKAWAKERRALKRKREKMWAEIQEVIRFYIWEELDRKLTEGDIDRLYARYNERSHDGFTYFLSFVDEEIAAIKEMDWFKDKPDYNYV